MVLSANNKVDVLGRSIRNSTLNRIESPTSSIKSNSSDETSSDKVRLNDELLHMIITNNMNNIITKTTTSSILNNNNNNNAQKSMITTKINPIIDDHHMKTKQFNDDDDLKNYNTTYHKIKQTKKTPTGFNTDSMMINSDVSNYMMKKNSQRMNTNAGVNDLMADSDPKKAMAASGNFNINKEMSTMLDSNRVRMMSIYFNYSSVVSHAIKDWFDVCID